MTHCGHASATCDGMQMAAPSKSHDLLYVECGLLRYSTSFSGYKILFLSNLMTLQHGVSLLLSQLLHFVSMRPSHDAGWLVAG